MKNHLKRIAAPKLWDINRAASIFIVRPKAGAHSLKRGMALGVLLRDTLHIANTLTEVRKLLSANDVRIDGTRRTEYRHVVGLFDILSIPSLKRWYRVLLTAERGIHLQEIPAGEQAIKVCKVTGKSVLPGGKIQIHLHDGRNVTSSQPVAVGDSVVITIPKGEVTEVLPLKPGMLVYIDNGRKVGNVGTLREIKKTQAVYVKDDIVVETAKKYLFVVGKEKPSITVQAH
ncbi:MAG: 30S ribosomal protein S4e [Nanoarchaeota archaeon]